MLAMDMSSFLLFGLPYRVVNRPLIVAQPTSGGQTEDPQVPDGRARGQRLSWSPVVDDESDGDEQGFAVSSAQEGQSCGSIADGR